MLRRQVRQRVARARSARGVACVRYARRGAVQQRRVVRAAARSACAAATCAAVCEPRGCGVVCVAGRPYWGRCTEGKKLAQSPTGHHQNAGIICGRQQDTGHTMSITLFYFMILSFSSPPRCARRPPHVTPSADTVAAASLPPPPPAAACHALSFHYATMPPPTDALCHAPCFSDVCNSYSRQCGVAIRQQALIHGTRGRGFFSTNSFFFVVIIRHSI